MSISGSIQPQNQYSMKSLFLLFAFTAQVVFSSTAYSHDKHTTASPAFFAAVTVGSNFSSTDFIITFKQLSTGNTQSYYMPVGFYNNFDKWHLVPGFYDVTIAPVGSYSSVRFSANASSSSRNSPGSTPLTSYNVEFYEGGGNQIMIND